MIKNICKKSLALSMLLIGSQVYANHTAVAFTENSAIGIKWFKFLDSLFKVLSNNEIYLFVGIILGYFVLEELFSILTRGKYRAPKLVKTNNRANKKKFMERNPEFKEKEFLDKVKIAFDEYLVAMENRSVNQMKRFVSNGLAQEMSFKFEMMDILGKVQSYSLTKIKSIYIDQYEVDGERDVLHVGINYSVKGSCLTESYPKLNQKESKTITAFWSFMRASDNEIHDLFTGVSCPACSTDLNLSSNKSNTCPNCDTEVNNGLFDWVLFKFTTEHDYIYNNRTKRTARLIGQIDKAKRGDSSLSIKEIEDLGTMAYIKLIKEGALKDAERVRKFISDDLYKKLSSEKDTFIYDHFFMNHAYLIDLNSFGDTYTATVKLKSSFKRVVRNEDDVTILDRKVNSRNDVIILERVKKSKSKNGLMIKNVCPKCGANIMADFDTCHKCGLVLPDEANDWLVIDFLSLAEYNNLKSFASID